MNFKFRHITLIFVIFFSVSCKSYFKKVPSLIPIENKKVENLGKAGGSDSAVSVLGLWMIGRPDTRIALKKAIETKGADTLINVNAYESYYWFLLFSVTTVNIEGEAVKIIGDKNETRKKKRYKK